jgi:hypothetical protein
MRVTNGTPLGCSPLLPVGIATANCVQTLKGSTAAGEADLPNHGLCHTPLNELKGSTAAGEADLPNHELCHTLLNELKGSTAAGEADLPNHELCHTLLNELKGSTAAGETDLPNKLRRLMQEHVAVRGYGARFLTGIYTRGCHWSHACSLEALACMRPIAFLLGVRYLSPLPSEPPSKH